MPSAPFLAVATVVVLPAKRERQLGSIVPSARPLERAIIGLNQGQFQGYIPRPCHARHSLHAKTRSSTIAAATLTLSESRLPCIASLIGIRTR